MIQERIPARFGLDPFRDVQVLSPMNRTELGVVSLNQKLQEALNPAQSEEEPQAQCFGTVFRGGDKVLQTINNYDKQVFNGDVGRVKHIDVDEQELTVDFDGVGVPYTFDELDELSLAYALTIHKSQGSEYPAVIIPLHTQHFIMLQRNLIYTGLTSREAQKIILRQGRKLFGPPDEATTAALAAMDDLERLELLSEQLLDVKSWQELLAR